MGLVTYDQQQAERVTADLFRIGYEEVKGYLPFKAWLESGGELASLPVVDAAEARRVLASGKPVADVRFAYEQDELPLPGTRRLPVEALRAWSHELAEEPLLVVCASGQRASMAASMLRRQGIDATAFASGGAADLV